MGYKPLTKKGEEFITNRCLANTTYGSNRFSGKRKFALPKSILSSDTVFVAQPRDEKNQLITTPDVLAKNLISWFNRYSEDYQLDANIIAAQAYAESGYNLWIYSEGGAMGLCQFLDTAVFDTVIKNKYTFDQELQNILTGLNGIDPNANKHDIRYIIPHYNSSDKKIISTKDTIEIAKNNRSVLFQNVINNPKLMIKAQCYLMNFIGGRNNNLASSSLFAYNRGAYLTSTSYDDMINKTSNRYGKEYLKEGLNYVDRIFKLLAGKEPLVPVGFGYQIDFTDADLRTFNISDTVILSGNYPLPPEQEKFIKDLHPLAQDIFRQFIYTIEKETPFKVQITSGYRSYATQARVKAENEAYDPPRPAASPGNSFHNYGLGIDINLFSTTNNKLIYAFNKSVKEWQDTKVPSIGDRLGLRWGGTFNTPDQVHFDLGNKYSINQCKTLAQQTYGTDPNDVIGNQIPLTA